MDSSNILSLNRSRMEGKRELPLTKRSVRTVWILFILIAIAFLTQIFFLQIVKGGEYRSVAENNRFDKALIIAERGVVYDRRDEMMVWNEADDSGSMIFRSELILTGWVWVRCWVMSVILKKIPEVTFSGPIIWVEAVSS